MEDIDEMRAGEVINFHINDAGSSKPRELLGDADRLMPGDGEIPLVEMIRRMKARGYDGKVMVELFSPVGWRRPVGEVCQVARRKAEAVLAKV